MKTKLLFLILAVILCLGTEKAKCETDWTYHWIATSAGTWNTAANWYNESQGKSASYYPGYSYVNDTAKVLINATINVTATVGATGTGDNSNGTIGMLDIGSASNKVTVNLNVSSGVSFLVNLRITVYPGSTLNINYSNTTGSVEVEAGGDVYNAGTITVKGGTFQFDGTTSNPSYFYNNGTTTVTGTSASALATFDLDTYAILTNGGSTYTTAAFNLGAYSNMTMAAGSDANINYGTFTASGTGNAISMAGTTNNYSIFTNNAITSLTSTAFTFNNYSELINSSGATCTASAATFTLSGTVAYISNTGTFNAGTDASVCNFAVSSSSYIINNSGGIFMLGPLSIVTLAGTSYLSNSGTFTLMSTGSGSAMIGQITSTTSPALVGKYNVQRFVTGGSSAYRGYRLVSSTVNATSATLSGSSSYIALAYMNIDQTPISTKYYGALTGGPSGTTNGFSVTNSNPTIYIYNDSKTSSSSTFVSGKTVGITSVNNSSGTTTKPVFATLSGTIVSSTSLGVGNGFMMYYIGNDSITTTSSSRVPNYAQMTATGYLNSGTFTVYPWNTGTTYLYYASGAGYNLVGNPYPCTIDLAKVYSDNGSVYPVFYELDDYSHAYVSYNASSGAVSSSRASEYVAGGQGFFVKATAASQTLIFKEDQKVTTKQISTSSSPYLVLAKTFSSESNKALQTGSPSNLHLKLEKDSATYDECGIYFKNGWSDKYDQYDSFDIDATIPKVYLSSYTTDSVRTAINGLADYINGKSVRLYVKAVTSGTYSLQLEDMTGIDTSAYTVTLRDTYKKDSVNIAKSNTYSFDVLTTDTSSFGANRFVLVIGRKSLPAYKFLSLTAAKATKGVLLTWKTANEGDYTGFTIQKQDGTEFNPLYVKQSDGSAVYTYTDTNPVTGTNVYRLKQSDINDTISYSRTVSVVYNTSATDNGLFSVYPNPAKTVLTVNINEASTTAATSTAYKMSVYNSVGILVMQKSVSSNNWSQDVSQLMPGVYSLVVQNSNGSSAGRYKFLKVE